MPLEFPPGITRVIRPGPGCVTFNCSNCQCFEFTNLMEKPGHEPKNAQCSRCKSIEYRNFVKPDLLCKTAAIKESVCTGCGAIWKYDKDGCVSGGKIRASICVRCNIKYEYENASLEGKAIPGEASKKIFGVD